MDSEEKVLAEFSKMRPDEEIDAWGMARATGVEPLTAEHVLNQLVQEGIAVKEGNWYSMNLES
jgi:DNA-binding transcriptional regulator YhcF (GntR family)